MSFTDPQSITIGGTTTALARVSSGVNSGTYQSSDGTIKLSISHTYGKRVRRSIRLDLNKIAADPFVAGNNDAVSMSVYTVVDIPKQGYSIDEQVNAAVGLYALGTASTNAGLKKFVGGEN